MKDRVPKYPGRVKITRADGTSEYVTIERADEPVSGNEGTPLNKATLLSDDTATKLKLTSDDPTVDEALKKLKTDADTPAFCYLFDVKKAYVSTAMTKQEFNASLAKPAEKVIEAQGDIFLSPDMTHALEIKINSTGYTASLGSYRIGTIDLESGDITFSATQSLPGAYTAYSYLPQILQDVDNDGAIITYLTAKNRYSLYFLHFDTGVLELLSTSNSAWSPTYYTLYEVAGKNFNYMGRNHDQYIITYLKIGENSSGNKDYAKQTVGFYNKTGAQATSVDTYCGLYTKYPGGLIYADASDTLLRYIYYAPQNFWSISFLPGQPSGALIEGAIATNGGYSPRDCGPNSTFARGDFLHAAYKSKDMSSSGNYIYYENTYDISGTGAPILLSQASKEGQWPNAFNQDNAESAKNALRLYDPVNKKIVSGVSRNTTADKNGNINSNLKAASPDCIRTRTLSFGADTSDKTALYVPRTVSAPHLCGIASYTFKGNRFIKVPWLKNVVLTDFGLLWIDMDNLKAV